MERSGAVWAMVAVMLASACSKASDSAWPGSQEPAGASVAVAKLAATNLAGTAPGPTVAELGRLDRKIIRSANLGIETSDPADAERAAITIVEDLGGYAASSDRSLRTDSDEPATPAVNLVLRVPSEHFTVAIGRLQKLASRVLEQRVSSDDVTEEFIDLKARTLAQRALEAQFLEILKQAKSVKDALEVNTHLADVRTTIEKLEGRQRLLENQTAISTIKLRIAQGVPLVRARRFAFGDSLEHAGADLLNVSAAILHGGIRVLGVVTPALAFLVLPGALLRAFFRRRRRQLAGT